MKKRTSLDSVSPRRTLAAGLVAIMVAAVTSAAFVVGAQVAAAQQGDVVIGAGKIAQEYNLSTGSQLGPTRSLLLDPAAFGPGGTVDGPTVTIAEDVATITPAYLAGLDILFDGWARTSDWSSAELSAVDSWVRSGGVLVTTNDDDTWDGLGELFGVPTGSRTGGTWSAASATHPIVSGPFGSWTTVQGAGWISHLGTPSGWTTVATDPLGNSTIVEAPVGNGHVIILSDEGPFRTNFTGSNRIMAGNLFAFAIDAADLATPTPTPTTAPTATPQPTVAPIPTPTAVPAPTSTPVPIATAAPTTPPSPTPSLELVTNTLASMVAGDTAWVVLTWRGLAEVDDLRVTLTNTNGVAVAYPTNTADHSGPSQGYALGIGETDYTAFRLTVPEAMTSGTQLTASVTWTAFGQSQVAAIPITLPTVAFTGQDLQVLTTTTSVSNGWVDVRYLGLAPVVSDLKLVVTDPDGATIEYPRGSYTSLENDNELVDGETDLARFFVGTTLASGSNLTLETSYVRAGLTQTISHLLSIN